MQLAHCVSNATARLTLLLLQRIQRHKLCLKLEIVAELAAFKMKLEQLMGNSQQPLQLAALKVTLAQPTK